MQFTLEQIEKLRERTNATYEEAKHALEMANGDMLDALIFLERGGKIPNAQAQQKMQGNFSGSLKGAFQYLVQTQFVVQKAERTIVALPLILAIPLAIFGNMFTIVLLLIALFTGHRFRLLRPNGGGNVEETINQAFDTISKTAQDIKTNVTTQQKPE